MSATEPDGGADPSPDDDRGRDGEPRSFGPDGLVNTVTDVDTRPPAPMEDADVDPQDVVDIIQRPTQAVTRVPNGPEPGEVYTEQIGLDDVGVPHESVPGGDDRAKDDDGHLKPDLSQRLPKLELPGFRAAYDECGDDAVYFCTDCGDTFTVGSTCRRSVCERCAPARIRERAVNICTTLSATWAKRYTDDVKYGPYEQMRYHHVVLSPPWHWAPAAEDSLETTLDVVKDVLRQFGCDGYIFPHPFSGKDGDDRGEWKERLFKGRDWEDVAQELEFRPHFHCIVVAPYIPGGDVTKTISEETGWTIHRITQSENSNVSIYGDVELMAAVQYCLSHTGIKTADEWDYENNHMADTYFGSTLTSVNKPDDTELKMDLLSRSVAPKILDLDYNSLACANERDQRADHAVEVEQVARTKRPRSMASSGDDPTDVSAGKTDLPDRHDGELPRDGSGDLQGDSADVPDSPGDGVSTGQECGPDCDCDGDDCETHRETSTAENEGGTEENGTVRCRGRLKHVRFAEKFLEDNAWVARAPHADELRTAYHEYLRFGDATTAMGSAHDLDEDPYQQELDDPPPDAPAD